MKELRITVNNITNKQWVNLLLELIVEFFTSTFVPISTLFFIVDLFLIWLNGPIDTFEPITESLMTDCLIIVLFDYLLIFELFF